jgi:ATP-dependent Lhr-like helicase
MSGEQFALPDAIVRLREVRRSAADHRLFVIGTADPLNLAGIVTSGDRVRASARNRLAYRDGVPVAVLESGDVRMLTDGVDASVDDVTAALRTRSAPVPPRTLAVARPASVL